MMECRSYDRNSLVCKSGFVQKSLCMGHYGCPTCGAMRDSELPACITGEIPEHLFPVWEHAQPTPPATDRRKP